MECICSLKDQANKKKEMGMGRGILAIWILKSPNSKEPKNVAGMRIPRLSAFAESVKILQKYEKVGWEPQKFVVFLWG